ncbi:uncharacterized protein F5147DRAFT_695146, partial [Suillus discolor]
MRLVFIFHVLLFFRSSKTSFTCSIFNQSCESLVRVEAFDLVSVRVLAFNYYLWPGVANRDVAHSYFTHFLCTLILED